MIFYASKFHIWFVPILLFVGGERCTFNGFSTSLCQFDERKLLSDAADWLMQKPPPGPDTVGGQRRWERGSLWLMHSDVRPQNTLSCNSVLWWILVMGSLTQTGALLRCFTFTCHAPPVLGCITHCVTLSPLSRGVWHCITHYITHTPKHHCDTAWQRTWHVMTPGDSFTRSQCVQ